MKPRFILKTYKNTLFIWRYGNEIVHLQHHMWVLPYKLYMHSRTFMELKLIYGFLLKSKLYLYGIKSVKTILPLRWEFFMF